MPTDPHVPSAHKPEASRPRMFGGHLQPVMLPWRWAEERLVNARNYWIATTHPEGRPHCRPVWGVWLDDNFYFSTGSLAVGNLAANPEITVHLESGSEVVIVEGVSETVAGGPVTESVVAVYNTKYGWDMNPENLPGPFYAVRPRIVFGWISDQSGLDGGAAFHGTTTKWKFPTATR